MKIILTNDEYHNIANIAKSSNNQKMIKAFNKIFSPKHHSKYCKPYADGNEIILDIDENLSLIILNELYKSSNDISDIVDSIETLSQMSKPKIITAILTDGKDIMNKFNNLWHNIKNKLR